MKKFFIQCTELLDMVRFWDWHPMLWKNTIAALALLSFTGTLVFLKNEFVVYVVYSFIAFSFGFIVNNLSDRRIDVAVGKDYFLKATPQQFKVLSAVLLILLISIPFYFQINALFVVVAIGLLIGISYSLPPIRLKERGLLGVIAPIIAQRLPFTLFFFLLPEAYQFVLYLFIWLLIDGFIVELDQQLHDLKNDTTTATDTYLTRIGNEKAQALFYVLAVVLIFYLLLPLLSGEVLLTALLLLFSMDTLRVAQMNINAIITKHS